MTGSAALLIALTATSFGTDADAERIIGRVKEHFSAIRSMRVRYTEYQVESGGLWAADPETNKAVHKADGVVREFDIWVSHPKLRWLGTERSSSSGAIRSNIHEYFDGQVFTHLTPANRMGLVMQGGAMVKPLSMGALHAIGFCFPDTYQSSFTTLLGDPSKVAVKRLGGDDSKDWLVEVRGLPNDLRPRDWSDKNRARVLVRIWLTAEAENLRVKRWAIYDPYSKGTRSPAHGKPLPIFHLDGYKLWQSFVNLYGSNPKKAGFWPPTRILIGNGNGSFEILVKEMAINPKEAADTFRTAIPAGYSITRPNDDGTSSVTVTGGQKGTAQKVQEISGEARAMLASGEPLRAPTVQLSDWLFPGAAFVLVLAGVATLVVVRRRKNA